jgi:hypothetical protein
MWGLISPFFVRITQLSLSINRNEQPATSNLVPVLVQPLKFPDWYRFRLKNAKMLLVLPPSCRKNQQFVAGSGSVFALAGSWLGSGKKKYHSCWLLVPVENSITALPLRLAHHCTYH